MKELLEKLHTIQQGLKAPKTLYNKFGKYPYRSAETIMEALKPHLLSSKLIIYFTDSIVNIGTHNYLEAKLTLQDIENEQKEISTTGYAKEDENLKGMVGSQITGSSSSYARKYALNAMFAIDDNKDADDQKPTWWWEAVEAIKKGSITIDEIVSKKKLSVELRESLLNDSL